MEYDTAEMTRQYRLNFNRGEPLWTDGIPPEITSDVTGIRTTRTSRSGEPARLDIAEHRPRRDRRFSLPRLDQDGRQHERQFR